ncbi:uncharacterized protein FA14DRAFT_64725 [Meira miltonrushii]|uniref:Uncharacterized protein n=1 Tax=Meira miltonrushii TaxID=1280837 RepID=A0A316V7V9_9BASI|nr:uncharacterized protein FA14DRAFT_64725 [Meira miltonrushii]PWN33697.1 hypothetical protein FA14DRAFT_64725 [Meira miltonrushii]
MIDAISSSNHQPVTMEENGEPRLFVHIPIQWPSARKSVSSTETNKLQNLFIDPKDETYPSSCSSSTRPKMSTRSLSNRQYTSTKQIAAAVSTQKENRKRRSRVVSTDSNSSSSSFSTSTTSEDEQKINTSDSQQEQQKFATLPKSQANTMRKILERRRHARSNSVPDAPARSLHVDTFLPLHLPPPDLCAKSPLLSYPCSWWPTEDDKETKSVKEVNKESTSSSLPIVNAELRRSESLASFISAHSDGSWHGDHGDDDPDGQLARALGEALEKDQVDSNEDGDVSNNYQETSNAKDSTQHGHGPLQISTYDYDEEDDHNKVPHAHVTTASSSKGKEATKAEEEQDIAKSAGPLMQRLANYMFNLSMFGTDQNDQSSPLESGMSHSQSDGHLPLSSPSSLNAERKAKQVGRYRLGSSIRSRAATIAGDIDLLAHGEVVQEDMDKASGLWSLWRWIIPDIDSYMNDSAVGSEKDSQAMKRNVSVPSLVSGYSLDTVEEDEWDEEEHHSNKVESSPTPSANFKSLSPPQLCYAESYLRDSGFGLKSFESSAFNEFNLSGEVPAKILSIRNHLPTSILVRTEDVLGKQGDKAAKHSSSDPSPLWDNRLVEEPYERTWGSMLGLSVY